MPPDSHVLEAQANRILLIGKTAAGAYVEVKVTDDGSGNGILAVSF